MAQQENPIGKRPLGEGLDCAGRCAPRMICCRFLPAYRSECCGTESRWTETAVVYVCFVEKYMNKKKSHHRPAALREFESDPSRGRVGGVVPARARRSVVAPNV